MQHSFCGRSRDVVMATNFRGKIGKIGILNFICCTGIPKLIKILYTDVHVNSANDSSTQCKNLVSFGTVTVEFTKLQCSQQVSRSIGVSLTTFTKGLHC